MRYLFSDVELDVDRRELRRSGEELPVEPMVFDVLAMLVAHSDRMLTKEEMLDTIWGDRFVSESALSSRIKSARRAVGDNGRDQRVIRTFHGRGFRLVAEVSLAPQNATDLKSSANIADPAESETVAATPRPESAGTVLNATLPRRRSYLVGRSEELRRAREAIEESELVSLVGPGGVGKTSLAIEAAHQQTERYPGGMWFCELARAVDGAVASSAIGTLTGNAGTGRATAKEVSDALPDKRSLLILDNCEHLVDEVARFVGELGELTVGLDVLVTSREPLDLRGEQIIRLDGLEHAELDSPGVDLFVQRANEIVDLPDDASTRAIAREIVSQIEGLPLAIELAAPRLASASPEELLAALDDQLSVLASRRRHSDRQSAMDRAIGWSFDLLEDESQRFLCDLAIFATPFTRESVIDIICVETSIETLHRLVEQSMVSRTTVGGVTRFRLLEPIRQFVARRVEDHDLADLAERHARYFSARVSQLAGKLSSDAQPLVAETITAEWADIGRAVAWARVNNVIERAVDPLLDVGLHLIFQQRLEAFDWLSQAMASFPDLGARETRMQILLGFYAWDAGDRAEATALLKCAEAKEITLETLLLSSCLDMTGNDVERLVRSTEQGWQRAQELSKASRLKRSPLNQSDLKPSHLAQTQGAQQQDAGIMSAIFASYRLIARSLAGMDESLIDEAAADVDSQIELNDSPTALSWGLLAHLTRAVLGGRSDQATSLRQDVFRLAVECRSPWYAQIAGSLTSRPDVERDDTSQRLADAVSSIRGTVDSGRSSHYSLTFRTGVISLAIVEQHVAAAQIIGLIETLEAASAILDRLSGGYAEAMGQVEEQLGSAEFERLVLIGRRLSPEQGALLAETALEVLGQIDKGVSEN